jgi:hypothetical protein
MSKVVGWKAKIELSWEDGTTEIIEDFKKFLFSQDIKNKAIILMSSGNYGGLDFEEVKNLI